MVAPLLPRKTSNAHPAARKTRTSRWIRRGQSAIHGRGVYARELIPDGTHIVEYTGELITKAESKRREARRLARQRRGGDDCVYIFNLNRRHDLDGRARRNVARLINHSCAPNCRADAIRGRIWIVARRDIPANEELTFDYGFSFTEWRQHPCRCGGARCPGFIVGGAQRWRLRRISRAERAGVRSKFKRE
jgi:SET domain-containing protein